jgi:two-component system, OmpR family, KDP operon response regulator KdpE
MSEPIPILVIDDEAGIRRFLRHSLDPEVYNLLEAESGEEGMRMVATKNPAVLLLDLGLPDIDGVEVARQLREWSHIPIIVLSARDREQDKIAALDAGADDYLTKPFGLGELLARIRVALRNAERLSEPAPSIFAAGDLDIDVPAHIVRRRGKEVHLTPIEFKLLAVLVKNAGRVVTHRKLLTDVWGPAFDGENHYLRVYMGQLRHKLEDDPAQPRYLATETGVGYRFLVE